jgi:hypothetical protein
MYFYSTKQNYSSKISKIHYPKIGCNFLIKICIKKECPKNKKVGKKNSKFPFKTPIQIQQLTIY